MYEFRAGTGRLIDALDRAKADRKRPKGPRSSLQTETGLYFR